MPEPVVPLGTRVKAKTAGWDAIQEDSYDASYEEGLDILPAGVGVPEWVEGDLEGFDVEGMGYFKHVVDGYDVDPSTIEELGTNGESTAEATIVASSGQAVTDSKRLSEIDRDLRAKLHVAANDHMSRALERAGAKVRTKMSRTAGGRNWLSEHPCNNGVLVRIVPRAHVAASGLEESMIFEAAWQELQPIWSDYVNTGDIALLRQMSRMLGVDINQMSTYSDALKVANDESWTFVQARLDDLAKGYMSDSATVVAVDEITTSNLVDMNVIRQAIAEAAGANTYDPTSAGVSVDNAMRVGITPQLSTGPIAEDGLKGGGYDIDGYVWVHGFTPNPFAPHVALDGLEFTEWSDPRLANTDGFPANDFYAPGDHAGCQCDFYIKWATPVAIGG